MGRETTIEDVGKALRAIRLSRKLSLSDVEKLSNGEVKAVVLGSYERGDRSISIKRAIVIAAIYEMPLGQLIDPVRTTSTSSTDQVRQGQIIIDTRKLMRLSEQNVGQLAPVARFVHRIIRLRQDWNGEVISLRASDIPNISLLLERDERECLSLLSEKQLLLTRTS
ncbi:Cro/C1-type helix-turn-helix domain [Candidatus Nanopelagicaceae bacterium]